MIDWATCEVVERVPGKVSGAFLVRGTRIPADTIVDNAESGLSPAEIAEQFPGVSVQEIDRLLAFYRANQTVDAAG